MGDTQENWVTEIAQVIICVNIVYWILSSANSELCVVTRKSPVDKGKTVRQVLVIAFCTDKSF